MVRAGWPVGVRRLAARYGVLLGEAWWALITVVL